MTKTFKVGDHVRLTATAKQQLSYTQPLDCSAVITRISLNTVFTDTALVGRNWHLGIATDWLELVPNEPITMAGKYQTRDGQPVRVLCIDAPDKDYPVVAIVGDGLDAGPEEFTAAGAEFGSGISSELDLIPIPPPSPEKYSGWVNVYPGQRVSFSILHQTRELADTFKIGGRIACVPCTVTEGEGL